MKKRNVGLFNIILLGIVSLFNDASSELIKPILPAFLLSLGATGFIVGLVGGIIEAVPNLLKVFSGFLADKIGKYKPFVFFGYGLSAISRFFLIIVKTPINALLFIAAERSGKGIRDAPRDAIIANYKKIGKGFGIHRAFDTSGAIIGCILALIFVIIKLNLKSIILIASIIGLFSLIPITFVKENKAKQKKLNLSALIKLPKKLKIFFIIASIFTLANFSYMFFILTATKKSLAIPIFLYVLFNIFYALFSIPLGKLGDKIGKKKVLVFGYLLFSFVCLLFTFFSSFFVLIILFILYGISMAAVNVNHPAYVSDLVTKNKATALGAFYTLTGIVALASSMIAGELWQINHLFTFLYGFVISFIAGIILAIFKDGPDGI